MAAGDSESTRQKRRNGRIASALTGLVLAMIALSFASVPLYRVFCQVTGYGGTTNRAAEVPDHVLNREITVQFNADVNRELPWVFRPDVRQVRVQVGAGTLVSFFAKNLVSRPTVGMAVYNVTPQKVGKYFSKVQCFCFDEQVLGPGQQVEMPVYFFVDPAIADDPQMDDVHTITLSYTFFQAQSDRLDEAIKSYYQELEQISGVQTTTPPPAVN
jgi:cytochrome c oxidase assembly protein subunit 11